MAAWRKTMPQTVVDDIDIYRSAKQLIDKHGENAGIEASMRTDAMLEQGDLDGNAVWIRILEAVKELQNTAPVGLVHQRSQEGRLNAAPLPRFEASISPQHPTRDN